MALFPSTSFLFLVGLCLFSLAEAQGPYYRCGNDGKFTANSTYQSNLNLLLSALASNASASFFDKSTVGQIPDRVYGLVYCRDDVDITECSSCLDAYPSLLQSCPYDRTAMVGYDNCFLRFSNQQFLVPSASNSDGFILGSPNMVRSTDVDRFSQLVLLLLHNITERAMANSTRMSSTGELSNFTSYSPTIYGMVQCSPDMSPEQCGSCLRGEFSPLPTYLVGRNGGRIVADRCIYRYETNHFFEGASSVRITVPLPPPSEAPASPPSRSLVPLLPSGDKKESKNKKGMVLAITLSIGAVLLLVPLCFCFLRRRRKQNLDNDSIDPQHVTGLQSTLSLFDLSTLQVATSNFSEHNKLGEGGFGAVYKGLLPNGLEIAVKKLLNHGQGLGELRNELILVAKLQHRNLVKLLGVSLEDEKMIVYEYVPNKSLDTFLFADTWHLMLEILTGRRNSGSYNSEAFEDLLGFAWNNWNGGTPLEIVDPALEGHYAASDVMRCIQIGLLCVQENPTDRPTMGTVNVMLNSETTSMRSPSRPAFCAGKSDRNRPISGDFSIQDNHSHDHQRHDKLSVIPSNEVSISDLEPR